MREIEEAMKDMESLANSSDTAKPSRGAKLRPKKHPERERKSGPRERRPRTAHRAGRTPRKAKPARAKGPLHQRIITFLVAAVVAIVLPFYLLLRGSVWLNQTYGVWPWVAVLGGMAATVLLLMLYAAWASWRFGSGFKFSKGVARGLMVLVAMYVGYSAIYISAANVKTPDVRRTYTSLHPLLRLATSTLILVDSDIVMTDGERKPEDYTSMGLLLNERSLHFRQEESGYVHAVDLRTRGREEWKNFLMTVYFKLAGFKTLRHTGTADHLHVSLGHPPS